MAEKRLTLRRSAPAGEEMRREAVPEFVRTDLRGCSCAVIAFEDEPDVFAERRHAAC